MHNACVGGGVDLVTACDMRYCTQDFYMQVKVGIALYHKYHDVWVVMI